MNISNIDVLNLEWTSGPSRDRVMATLVCNYLREQGCDVVEGSVFDGYHLINKLKPKLFFITNTVGAPENLALMKYAKSRDLFGISLISEGNFQGDSKFHQEMIWGWNKTKKLEEDIHIQWSERTRQITIEHQPELQGRVKVSGGVGFDNYAISSQCIDKIGFLSKYGKAHFQKVIGIGCWDFGCLYPEDSRYGTFRPLYTEAQVHRFRQDGIEFDSILYQVVSSHQEILFLVKHHPGLLLGHKGAGTQSIAELNNVIIIKSEVPIFDCISISDFWVVYESTTALEAWLLSKQTCLLNPSGRDFPRDIVNIGSPDYRNANQLHSAINEFYKSGHLPGFDLRREERQSIIQQIIQWDDGLNHVRAGNEILDLLESSKKRPIRQETSNQKITRWRQHIRWLISPLVYQFKAIPNHCANRNNFNQANLIDYAENKRREQADFYKIRGFTLSQLREVRGL